MNYLSFLMILAPFLRWSTVVSLEYLLIYWMLGVLFQSLTRCQMKLGISGKMKYCYYSLLLRSPQGYSLLCSLRVGRYCCGCPLLAGLSLISVSLDLHTQPAVIATAVEVLVVLIVAASASQLAVDLTLTVFVKVWLLLGLSLRWTSVVMWLELLLFHFFLLGLNEVHRSTVRVLADWSRLERLESRERMAGHGWQLEVELWHRLLVGFMLGKIWERLFVKVELFCCSAYLARARRLAVLNSCFRRGCCLAVAIVTAAIVAATAVIAV